MSSITMITHAVIRSSTTTRLFPYRIMTLKPSRHAQIPLFTATSISQGCRSYTDGKNYTSRLQNTQRLTSVEPQSNGASKPSIASTSIWMPPVSPLKTNLRRKARAILTHHQCRLLGEACCTPGPNADPSTSCTNVMPDPSYRTAVETLFGSCRSPSPLLPQAFQIGIHLRS